MEEFKGEVTTPENNSDKFQEIGLGINEPTKIHNYEIAFNENNKKLVTAYNIAINEVCNNQNEMGMFHQTGRENEPWYHAREDLRNKATGDELIEIMKDIHEEAAKTYEKFTNMGLFG